MADSMTFTSRLSVVAKRMQEILLPLVEDESFYELPVQHVFYGDQERIPAVPCIAVEPVTKSRTWPPKPNFRTENTFEIDILIYHSGADKTSETVKYEVDVLGELVEEYINSFPTMPDASGNELIIHGYVLTNEPGYYRRMGSLYHGTRLQWRGINQTQLTVAG
jgi:hypothetical protein